MKLKPQERTAYDALLDDFLTECINYKLPDIVRRVARSFFALGFELGRSYNTKRQVGPPRYTGRPKFTLVKG